MIYVSTRAGTRHATSEDAVLVGNRVLVNEAASFGNLSNGFVCVADGVGGNDGGAVAARFILERMAEITAVSDEKQLRDELTRVNEELIREGREKLGLPDMASTLTGIFFQDGSSFLVHVGNTRCYAQQGSYLKQLTGDHTVYNWLKTVGRNEEAEACNKSEITNCFGGGSNGLLSKLHVAQMPRYNRIILTSDGVHDYVDTDHLEELINGTECGSEACSGIIREALKAGSEDDLTVVIIEEQG